MSTQVKSNNSGYSYPENENIFKQNQLKLSVNSSIRAQIDEYRFKEMVDSFLTPQQVEYVDTLFQCVQAADEVNQEVLELLQNEINTENMKRQEENNVRLREGVEALPLVKIDFDKEIALTPTVNRLWAEAKTICQLSKGLNGNGVRTASTQKLIHEERGTYSNKDLSQKPPQGMLERVRPPKQEPEEVYEQW